MAEINTDQFICHAYCKILFFFSLQKDNSIKWASRWDYILVSMPHTNIQWFRYGVIFFFLLLF